MKNILKSSLALLLLLISFNNSYSQARRKAEKDTEEWRYELEAVQTGTQGTYLVKVWSYSKKPVVAIEQAKKNAIHGVIFKGFPGTQGVPSQSPLTNNINIQNEKEEFFEEFFKDGGDYMRFITLTNDGAVSAEDRLKLGKEYKIGVIVSVNVAELRKYLENKGIIRSLTSGF